MNEASLLCAAYSGWIKNVKIIGQKLKKCRLGVHLRRIR